MKTILLFLILNLFLATARGGNDGDHPGRENDGDHGGSPSLASKEVVEAAMGRLGRNVQITTYWIAELRTQLPKGKLSDILEKLNEVEIFLSTVPFQRLKSMDEYNPNSSNGKVKYILVDNDCPNKEHKIAAASTKLGQVGAPICFSLSELIKLSPAALDDQLIALAMHEHAHQFGFEEADAKLVQDYLVKPEGILVRRKQIEISTALSIANGLISDISDEILSSAPYTRICRSFGLILQQNSQIFMRKTQLQLIYDLEANLKEKYPMRPEPKAHETSRLQFAEAARVCGDYSTDGPWTKKSPLKLDDLPTFVIRMNNLRKSN